MEMSATIAINIQIVRGRDRALFFAAVEQLRGCLVAASSALSQEQKVSPPNIAYRFFSDNDDTAELMPGAVILWLFAALAQGNEPFHTTAARLHESIQALTLAVNGPVFLCTLFRHVPPFSEAEGGEARRLWLRQRIRRLNLLATDLSYSTGINIIDLDRTLAHLGAGPLQTDVRLGGERATAAAADTICGALLAAGLDDVVPEALLNRSQKLHGGLAGIMHRAERGQFLRPAGRPNADGEEHVGA